MTQPPDQAACAPPETIGMARLFAIGFGDGDFGDIIAALTRRVEADPADAAAQFDLGTILMLNGYEKEGLDCQAQAIGLSHFFRQPATGGGKPLGLLMLATPGGLMANTPAHFLLEGAGITLDTAFVGSKGELPGPLPPHDVLLVGIGESDETASLLRALAPRLAQWPKPVLNQPLHVLRLARERLRKTLEPAHGIHVPITVRVDREVLERLARGEIATADLLGGADYPIIARPAGSHAGKGLRKLESAADVRVYCGEREGENFTIAPFVDYRSDDGDFRKYRIAMIGGRPFVCHVAVGRRWMLHYLNAGMKESEENALTRPDLWPGSTPDLQNGTRTPSTISHVWPVSTISSLTAPKPPTAGCSSSRPTPR